MSQQPAPSIAASNRIWTIPNVISFVRLLGVPLFLYLLLGPHHDVFRVVTNLAVLDFAGPDHAMRIASVHPGVTVEEVQAGTGFPLHVDADVPTTREPTEEELKLLREVLDPKGVREKEVPS